MCAFGKRANNRVIAMVIVVRAGIIVRRERRRPYPLSFEDACAAHLGVARGNARKGEIAVAAEPQAFLDRLRNERRIADQLLALIVVGIEQIERTTGGAAGGRQ